MTIPVYISGSDASIEAYQLLVRQVPVVDWERRDIDGFGSLEMLVNVLQANARGVALLPALDLPYPMVSGIEVLALLDGGSNGTARAQHPLQGLVAVVSSDQRHGDVLKAVDVRQGWGHVSIAGFGPGDTGLVTRKTDAALAACDVVIYDDLIDADYLRSFKAEKIYAGKRKGKHHVSQDEINQLIARHALWGKAVVRLKGGDPLIFGRGAEEYHYLRERHIKAEIIPGISSALAAAASGIVPLTARGVSSSVVFLSGHDLVKLVIPKADTLVFFMGASNQRELSLRLRREGWGDDVPAVVIRNASLADMQMRRYTLATLADDASPLGSPSIIIVGYSTAEDPKSLPRKWLYTGIYADDFREGGQCVHSPMIAVEPIALSAVEARQLQAVRQYQSVLFASRHAVELFFARLMDVGCDARHLQGVQIYAIGQNTRDALRRMGIVSDVFLLDCHADEVMQWFVSHPMVAQRLLIPKPACGIGGLAEWLRLQGHRVDEMRLFNVVMPDNIIRHNLDQFHGVVFTSPSTVQNFLKTYGEVPEGLEVRGFGEEELRSGKVEEWKSGGV
ncbi:MAG: uroporphyrinogen-III C-methyltransferase [Marinilabiliaceae bacterium]|nr:uroporphyrinogen-III C-methyltransferase [Marinilabiliaceae bacterium]